MEPTENDIRLAGVLYALKNGLPAHGATMIWESAIKWYKQQLTKSNNKNNECKD